MAEESVNVKELEESYEIIGEYAAGGPEEGGASTFIAKRRDDGADVLISVTSTPEGDEGNALSHLAADANLLAGNRHRDLVPVLDGRWLGDNAFALVTARLNIPTLEELLTKREEAFDFPRIARILQDVNGVLEWARSQKVVHRAVDPDTLYLEPGSDRALVSFKARALPLADMPGAEDDARTVARLAHAMLSRSAAAPERANQSLAELRPGLPERVLRETETLLSADRASDAKMPDVRNYIAVIAMADTFKRSETECANAMRRMMDGERASREEIEKRRLDCERAVAEQQRRLEREREKFTKEIAAIQRDLARERENLQDEREELEKERQALAASLATSTPPTPPPPRPPLKPAPIIVPLSRTSRHGHPPKRNRALAVPMVAGALVLAIAVSLLAVSRNRGSARTSTSAVSAPAVVESEAGGVTATVARTDSVQAPDTSRAQGLPADLLSGIAARAESTPPPRPFFRRQPVQLPLRRDTVVLDTFTRRPPGADSLRNPSVMPFRRDSTGRPRPDSAAKRDSARRDTVIRRDTLPRLD